ncbi:flagellar biosynthetic protein FliO [Pseudoduganella namucuonensis]|uniref:Flagellar protein n=1 Tax=Pseudoduganella namucuonensis TaxID=1035707 RepID=A0A1I7KZP2_9BURK|nr:flagellar biosynthetic protein FliO [Pseudoduganella namucuonensis]SFV02972.1 flagellar protein FliO/FliZ [Pseudoduganella namucuonensis]
MKSMKPAYLFAALAASCCLAGAPALAAQTASGAISGAAKAAPAAQAPAAAPAAPAATDTVTASAAAPAPASPAAATGAPAEATAETAAPAAPALAPSTAATPEQQAALAGARPAADATVPPPTATGSLLQTVLALLVVLALLAGLAWLLKRYGPKSVTGGANVRLVGALNVGTRERILVVEVGEQWIVVGASPGRMNALATMPRQEGEPELQAPGHALPSANFAEWFKQTIEKRNGK